MIKSTVEISMQDENDLECSYAIIYKEKTSIIIILKECECAIFDYRHLKEESYCYHYLLLKHYENQASAYTDFLKLIGKMCKKKEESKYFKNHIEEDNRMVFLQYGNEHMIEDEERIIYNERYNEFKDFVLNKFKAELSFL